MVPHYYEYYYTLKYSNSFKLRKEKCSICNWILFEDADICSIDGVPVCDNCFVSEIKKGGARNKRKIFLS
jgi:hypothetical protein